MSHIMRNDSISEGVTAVAQPGAQVIEVIAKVESHDSVPNLEEIVEASDAVMVARGDLGAHLPANPIKPPYYLLALGALNLAFACPAAGAQALRDVILLRLLTRQVKISKCVEQLS